MEVYGVHIWLFFAWSSFYQHLCMVLQTVFTDNSLWSCSSALATSPYDHCRKLSCLVFCLPLGFSLYHCSSSLSLSVILLLTYSPVSRLWSVLSSAVAHHPLSFCYINSGSFSSFLTGSFYGFSLSSQTFVFLYYSQSFVSFATLSAFCFCFRNRFIFRLLVFACSWVHFT